MNKFIFLDIDGVLNDDETTTSAPYGGTGLDDAHLIQLKHLVDTTSAKIILSSDWRYDSPDWPFQPTGWKTVVEDWAYLTENLARFNLTISAIVPHRCLLRGNEISMFLTGKLPCQYVILDDLPLTEFKNHLPHLIHTNPDVGLTWDDVWEAQKKLKIIQKELFI